MTDNTLWIWFQLMFGIGTRRSHALMEYFAGPRPIWEGIGQSSQVVVMLQEEELLAAQVTMERAKELELRTLRKGCDIVTPDHPAYPAQLRDIFARPAVLYVKGELKCLENHLVIGMVGTRNHSDYGRDVAKALAGELASCGVVVVSGLARGIDTFCHQAALAAGGKSVGILGCGIDVDYPKGSAGVKRGLAEQGAVVTEYPLGSEPRRENFPMRNRLISGMAHGVVVVEADQHSGSMITAAHAVDQNREVFAVPGSIFEVREQGTHRLIREGAKLTERATDILEEFAHRQFELRELPAHKEEEKWAAKEETGTALARAQADMKHSGVAKPKGEQPQTGMALEPPERRPLPGGCSSLAEAVYPLIGPEPVTFETIAGSCDLEISQIQTALTELEIYGLIKGYPGRRFSL